MFPAELKDLLDDEDVEVLWFVRLGRVHSSGNPNVVDVGSRVASSNLNYED